MGLLLFVFAGAAAWFRVTDKVYDRLIVKVHASGLLFRLYAPPYETNFYRVRGYADTLRYFSDCKPFHVHIIGLYKRNLTNTTLFRYIILTNM